MPLSAIALSEAAETLSARRQTGQQGPRLPEACRPQGVQDALDIQQAVVSALREQVVAWKCGLPTPEGPVMAPIHARTVFTVYDVVCLVWTREGVVRIEPELAFVLGRDLPPRAAPYTLEEVEAAVSSVHLALELIDSRYAPHTELTFIDKLADGLVNQGLLLGPAVDKAQGLAAAAIQVQITADGQLLGSWAGAHPNAQPIVPLHWLVNELSRQGRGLRAHQAVITGSYAGAIPVPVGQDITVQFGDLGLLKARFKPA